MTLLLAASFGVLIGLTIGALGGGGSILTVPVLTFAVGLTAQESVTASLVIVGVTALVATAGHAREGNTRWRTGLGLAAAGVPGSLLGTRLNSGVDPDVLLLVFAGVMLVAAVGMLFQAGSDGPTAKGCRPPGGTGVRRWLSGRTCTVIRLAGLGALVGFLTGFLGVGGGFVVVPALVMVLGMSMPVAVGTSLLVVALNSGVALAARAGSGVFVWDVIVAFTVAAVAGSLVGGKVADRLPGPVLTRAFAVLLLGVAGYVAVRAGLALG